MYKIFLNSVLVLSLSGCLVTRSELAQNEQSAVYSQKSADNQAASQEAAQAASTVVDKDELIRNLNGRVEVLENQLSTLQQEREEEKKASDQKLTMLQEALAKLESHIQVPDTDNDKNSDSDTKNTKNEDDEMKSSDELEKISANAKSSAKKKTEKTEKKQSTLEIAEEHFAKKEWKKAILSFHKYTDEAPKAKAVPEAKYKIGVCFQELGMKEEAVAYFEEVVANYGSTEAGKKSKSRLAKLKK